MKNNPRLIAALFLCLITTVHGQLETLLTADPGNRGNATMVWTVNANGAASAVSGGNAVPTTGSLLNATGGFTSTWTSEENFNAATLIGALSTISGDKWSYQSGSDNLGPRTDTDTGINLVAGEAVVMAFDLTGLTLSPGYVLQLDHVTLRNSGSSAIDSGARFSFYDDNRGAITQLTGTEPGQLVPSAGNPTTQTLNQIVDSGDELALWRQSGLSGQVRLAGFQFSVVPEPLPPTANDDSLTMHLNTKALIPVLKNDSNLDIFDRVEIVNPPSFGSVTLRGNEVLYEQTSGTPLSDSFTYELIDLDDRTSTPAAVSIMFTSDVRIENTTLNVPPLPPVDSYSVENAFPGISFSQPLSITSPPDETDRVFVCEKTGTIQLVTDIDGSPSKNAFLNLPDIMVSRPNESINASGESGLLGLAFHPDYATNGLFYVFYSVDISGLRYQRVSRFSVSGNSDLADAASEQVLIEQRDEAGNHNGGDIQFGPDGYLYVSVGDEGGSNDQWNNSQTITKDYFAGLLRVDVDKKPGNLEPNPHPSVITNGLGKANYSVPADNYWVGATSFNGTAVVPSDVIMEFFAAGLRNPWRIHFDPLSGELYCADVGQNAREEVNIVTNGGNYGWAFFEASLAGPKAPAPAGFVHSEPIYEYERGTGEFEGRSISGGVVYRGTTYPELIGKYVFGDYTSGNIWTLDNNATNVTVTRLAGTSGPVGFGSDPSNGDVLIASISEGQVQRLVAGAPTNDFPATLSETGVFADLSDLSPNPGVLRYEPNLAFWSDHAIKDRWFVIPDLTNTFAFAVEDPWTFPSGMIWIKHFEIEMERGNPTTRKRLETRLLVKNDEGTYGVSYRWNDEETEAFLVPAAGDDFTLDIMDDGDSIQQNWRVPGRSQCITCHLPNAGHALSFNTRQLNREYPLGEFPGNQIATLRDAGYLTDAPSEVIDLPRHARPDETRASLEARVRSYLAVNCAYCHQSGGGNPSNWDGRPELSLQHTGLINGLLNNDGGDSSNRLVVVGDSGHSVLLSRIEASGGFGRMPPLASSELDQAGIDLMREWIDNELPLTFQTYAEWRLANFGSTNSAAGDPSFDFDSDGRDNEFEWLTRTDPKNTTDFWRATIGRDGLGGLELNFDWVLNRVTKIEESTNLVDWVLLDDSANHGFPAGFSTEETISLPAPVSQKRFYRFKILE